MRRIEERVLRVVRLFSEASEPVLSYGGYVKDKQTGRVIGKVTEENGWVRVTIEEIEIEFPIRLRS